MATGGSCTSGQCFWFSNNVEIPGEPTLPNEWRSVNGNVNGGKDDVFATSPWRAPGTAKVYGSGCGAAGGGPTMFTNGGTPPRGVPQGMDGLKLAAMTPTVWPRGSEQEVGWAISANHGGGYSYRLCKNVPGQVTEECFQKTPLKFVGNTSWIVYPGEGEKAAALQEGLPLKDACRAVSSKSQCGTTYSDNCLKCDHSTGKYDCVQCCPGCSQKTAPGGYTYCVCGAPPGPPPPPPPPPPPRVPFVNPSFTAGTFPAGSEWKRDPIPGCKNVATCQNQTYFEACGAPLPPQPGPNGGAWDEQVNCYGNCDGSTASKATGQCPPGTNAFAAPVNPDGGFFSGFKGGPTMPWDWSVVDKVAVPAGLDAGHYLLSWRWDCEESTQVWQNCADIAII